MKRKIAVFTGTRAEYGLLQPLLYQLKERESCELQLLVGGTHWSPQFGSTFQFIERDGFEITAKLDFLLSSDSPSGVAKSMALAMMSSADCLERLQPDLLVVLGDRYESLAVAQAAMLARLPIAHIHGGERTEGLIDEAIRHSLTKMAHLHFTTTEQYRRRVIQLGEQPENVFNFGAPGIDNIKSLKPVERRALSELLNIDITTRRFMMVTFHPVTLKETGGLDQLKALLFVLREFEDFQLVITYPNADTQCQDLIDELNSFKSEFPSRVALIQSVGQLNYLSLLNHCDVVVGNSSSGLIEAPSFGVPTVNIGERQAGRISGDTVIQCDPTTDEIRNALRSALCTDFKLKCKNAVNPYGEGNSASKMADVLCSVLLSHLLKKVFYDFDETVK